MKSKFLLRYIKEKATDLHLLYTKEKRNIHKVFTLNYTNFK